MGKQKRQHYLPKFYLEGFTNSIGSFFIYDRDKNEFREQTPINTAVEKDYYTIIDNNGEKNTGVEDLLSFIEGHAKPIIEKLDKKEKISKEEKENLSLFIAVLWTRVPDFDKSLTEFYDKIHKRINRLLFPSVEKTREILENFKKKTEKNYDITADEFFNFVQEERYNVETNKGYKLYSILKNSLSFANYFRQMDWLIAYSSSSSTYITTDNPFSLVPPEDYKKKPYCGYGIITKDTQKIITLTKKVCVIMLDKGDKIIYRNANEKQIFDINVFVTDNCDRFVIGNTIELLRTMVSETKIDKWKKGSRVSVG